MYLLDRRIGFRPSEDEVVVHLLKSIAMEETAIIKVGLSYCTSFQRSNDIKEPDD